MTVNQYPVQINPQPIKNQALNKPSTFQRGIKPRWKVLDKPVSYHPTTAFPRPGGGNKVFLVFKEKKNYINNRIL